MSTVTKFKGLNCEVGTPDNEGGMSLVMTCDLTKLGPETKTGKSNIVANTSGWQLLNTPSGRYKINCLIVKVKEKADD